MNWEFFIDLTGTIAFAISGAITAINRKLDLFGILFLSIITATGGGMLRDMMIGMEPPVALSNPVYFATCLITGFAAFFFYNNVEKALKLILIFDAIGLAFFTIAGVSAGLHKGLAPYAAVFTGLLTATGGGMMRDILADRIPLVLRDEIYATWTLSGAVIYLTLILYVPEPLAAGITMVFILVMRLVSLKNKWILPRKKIYRNKKSSR